MNANRAAPDLPGCDLCRWRLSLVERDQPVGLPSLALIVLVFVGSASSDLDYPRPDSAVPVTTDDAESGPESEQAVTQHPPDHAGFRALADGIDALSARLLLVARAAHSIDLQYYLIKNDIVGRTLLSALLAAADRGVRVRLLLDDIFTAGYDAGMHALDSHPNFEIRLFNPFSRGVVGRTLGAAASFRRINRRMHNKSFTVDNRFTIIGGRNIADEYFGAREDAQFGDLDVIGIGPVVGDVIAMFERYWNHETALALDAFSKPPGDADSRLRELRQALRRSVEQAKTSRYAEAVLDRALEQAGLHDRAFNWSSYALVYDSPDKGVRSKARDAGTVLTPLAQALQAASRDVLIVSPYFVPRRSGVKALAEMRARGVEVTIVTNSLAANNQFTVHGGYAPARLPLLRDGVRIFEMRPDASVLGSEYVNSDSGRATLHTKAFIVDRERVFIGSFNFDPRSANINTEMGVIIHDADLAGFFSRRVEKGLSEKAYRLSLDDAGKLRWLAVDGATETIYRSEPQTGWWQRFRAGFVRFLPIRGQL